MQINPLIGLILAAMLLGVSPAHGAETAQQLRARIAALKPDFMRGGQLFERCAACHASDGGGSVDGSVPGIAGQFRSVLIKQMVDYRYSRRWDPRMEVIANSHSLSKGQDIADVTAFAAALPFKTDAAHGDGADVAQGAELFGRLCASCHGARGEGNAAKATPRLAGQRYEYLRRQLYQAVDDRRPNFSNDHVLLLSRFQREDFTGVSDYLSRLSVATAAAGMSNAHH